MISVLGDFFGMVEGFGRSDVTKGGWVNASEGGSQDEPVGRGWCRGGGGQSTRGSYQEDFYQLRYNEGTCQWKKSQVAGLLYGGCL